MVQVVLVFEVAELGRRGLVEHPGSFFKVLVRLILAVQRFLQSIVSPQRSYVGRLLGLVE